MKNSRSDSLRYAHIASIISLAVILSATFSQPASAFKTGESAFLVIGQSNFNSNMCGGGLGTNTRSGLCDPEGSAFDSSGNLWVADTRNSRVLEFIPPFSNDENASLVIGQSGFTSNTCHGRFFGFLPTASGLCGPVGLAFDPAGNLWVADFLNSRVLEFASPFSNGESASLVIGQSGFFADVCSTTQFGLCRPSGLSFDPAGNLWVADFVNSRVLEFASPFSNGESASLVIGQSGFNTNICIGGVPGTFNFVGLAPTQSGLCDPFGIAFDSSGKLWIVDTANSRALEFKHPFSNGENASRVIGQPSFTTNTRACSPTQSGLCDPFGLVFDSLGNLWMGDFTQGRVLEFKHPLSNGENASLVIGATSFTTPSECFSTQSGLCLSSSRSLTFDPIGNLWVADSGNNRVLAFANEARNP